MSYFKTNVLMGFLFQQAILLGPFSPFLSVILFVRSVETLNGSCIRQTGLLESSQKTRKEQDLGDWANHSSSSGVSTLEVRDGELPVRLKIQQKPYERPTNL